MARNEKVSEEPTGRALIEERQPQVFEFHGQAPKQFA
jgi:hypothetical protein